jgi:hypothetical protein
MTTNQIQPPKGYRTWLNYAVEHFDTRSIQLDAMFDGDGDLLDRDAIRNAARAELDHLRAQLRAAKG